MIHDDAYWQKKDYKKLFQQLLFIVIGLPKTIYFNLHYFGIKGLCIPVLLSSRVKLKKMSGKVILSKPLKTAMIRIGLPSAEMFDDSRISTLWINDGVIEFKGSAGIRNGACIRNYGNLIFGNEFHTSSTARIICYNNIVFGNNVLIGWDVEITDGDAHKIYNVNSNVRVNMDKKIFIGNNVWIGSHVIILKGVKILDDCVIAAGTLLNKSLECTNVILGGTPVRILKKDIVWRV